MVKIIVDSAADYLPIELVKKDIEMVPLKLSFGSETFRDGVDITRENFYDKLMSTDEFPVTSQPSPYDFLDYFKVAKDAGDEVICITLASVLSGTFQSAVIAKDEVGYDKIYLMDSLTASLGIQYLADRACNMRDEGRTAQEIVEELCRIRGRIRVYFMADTLEYLYRGGRLSRTEATAGKLVKMKPVLTLDKDGKVSVADLCLGTSRAIMTMAKHLKTSQIDSDLPIYTLYSSGTENCEKLEEKLRKNHIDSFRRSQIGAVIGAHIGPGAAGLFYVEEMNTLGV